jgi:hypothetical protein
VTSWCGGLGEILGGPRDEILGLRRAGGQLGRWRASWCWRLGEDPVSAKLDTLDDRFVRRLRPKGPTFYKVP